MESHLRYLLICRELILTNFIHSNLRTQLCFYICSILFHVLQSFSIYLVHFLLNLSFRIFCPSSSGYYYEENTLHHFHFYWVLLIL